MINFITPLYRYDNIKIIYSNIIQYTNNFRWYLIEGSNKTGNSDLNFLKNDNRIFYNRIVTNYIWGHEQRNYFIKNINANNNDWCYFLDDDNLITKDLIDECNDISNNNIDIILFSQKRGITNDIALYGLPGRLKLGCCDIGSFLIRYKIIKNTFIYGEDQRNADGHYCEQIGSIPNINIKYCENKYVTYNALSKII